MFRYKLNTSRIIIEIVPFIIIFVKTIPLDMDKFKSKIGASVSEYLAYIIEVQQGISDQPDCSKWV